MFEDGPKESEPSGLGAPEPRARRPGRRTRLLAAVAVAFCVTGAAAFALISAGGQDAKSVRVVQGGTPDTTVAGSATPVSTLSTSSSTDIASPSSTDQAAPTTTISPYPPCTTSQLTSTLTVNKTVVVPGEELIVFQTYENVGPECTPQTAKAPPLLWALTSVNEKGQGGVGFQIFPSDPVWNAFYDDIMVAIPNPLPTGVFAKNSVGWDLGCSEFTGFGPGPIPIPPGTYQFHDAASWNPPPVSFTYDKSSCSTGTSTTTSTSTPTTSTTSTSSTTAPSTP